MRVGAQVIRFTTGIVSMRARAQVVHSALCVTQWAAPLSDADHDDQRAALIARMIVGEIVRLHMPGISKCM